MKELDQRSLTKLKGVHPDLIKVVKLGYQYSSINFKVTEGLRSVERQRELLHKGFSKTMNSKHLLQSDDYGHAIDVMAYGDLNNDGVVDQQDTSLTWSKPLYNRIALAMFKAAKELNISIRWGGNFKEIFDGPHFELL